MLELSSKNILVAGLGKSGLSVANRAKSEGANVWVYDDKLGIRHQRLPRSSDKSESLAMTSLRGAQPFGKATWQSQPTTNNQPPTTNFDLVVTSPGVPFNHAVLRVAAEKHWPIISEIEFAYLLLKPKFVIAVTGTNGKTTAVEMLSNIFKFSGRPYTVAGNIGTPLSSCKKIEDILILELSSFQLHFIDQFRANIAVLLNIEQDHLDWHCCFGQYLEDKLKIFENQQEGDIAVVNADTYVGKQNLPELMGEMLNGDFPQNVVSFSTKISADYYIKDGLLMAGDEAVIAAKDIQLKGLHNIANALAVLACAKEAGLSSEAISEGLKTFEGLNHRLQFVAQKKGISFYNDSKSTNPDSTKKAIEAFEQPPILIMGGCNKGNDFRFLKEYFRTGIKQLILYGEAASDIKRQLGIGHITKTLDEAVDKAVKEASPSSVILLSPGCASFDLYENYAKRGEAFVKVVKELDG